MRSLRMLVILLVVASYAASPLVGRWVSTASASTASTTSHPEAVQAPASANDNQSADCGSGDPRKQKKCHFNQANADNGNDNTGDVDSGQAPWGGLRVSNQDPKRGETISFTVEVAGNQLDETWWWLVDFRNDNGNGNVDSFANGETHYQGCDGNNSCKQSADLRVPHTGAFTIHAKARDRRGRESSEWVAEIHVH